MAVFSADAVNNGDTLTITAGITQTDANGNPTNVTNSWFGMDVNNNSAISGTEKTALAQGTTGLVIGVTTSAGASHSGCPTGSDSNAITAPWCFFGNTGSDYLTAAVTGGTATGLNLGGWTVTWNSIPAIPMGSGAWGTGFSICGCAGASRTGIVSTPEYWRKRTRRGLWAPSFSCLWVSAGACTRSPHSVRRRRA